MRLIIIIIINIIILIIMKLTKEELQKIYWENSNKKACKILGVTNSTLTKYLREFNIALKGSGNRNKRGKLTIEQ